MKLPATFLQLSAKLPANVAKGKLNPLCCSGGSSPVNASSVFQKLVAIGQAPTQLADVVMLASSLLMAISGICAVPKMVDIGLMDREVSTLSLSLACPLITIVSYVAPTPSVLEAVRLMKASNLNVIVFKLQAACNILSIAYGLQIANAAVLMTNMFGLACQVLFLAGERHASLESNWPSFALFLSVILNVGIFVASQYVPINLLGQSITVFNIFLYSSPLMNLGTALRTRNSSQFPSFMVGVNVLNNALWSVYALLIEDMVVLIPSLMGYACSFFQALLILWCRSYLPFDLAFLVTFFQQKKKPDDISPVAPKLEEDGEDAWL
mmetsp:Transcript_58939/g.95993  ORF Transcript_58939/g.95993 Transcript_58939/m.95993 type:complete len:324 (-) Transcript_58939:20-991(-)